MDNKEFNKKRAFSIFNKKKKESEEIIDNSKEKVFSKVAKATKKANDVKGTSFSVVFEDFKLLLSMIGAYSRREYTKVPKSVIVAAFAATLYFISPIDAIMDFIPGLGYLDDAFVVSYVIKKFHEELQNYKAWKDGRFFS